MTKQIITILLILTTVSSVAQRNVTGCYYNRFDSYPDVEVFLYEDNHYDIVFIDDYNTDVVSDAVISQGEYQLVDSLTILLTDMCYFAGLEMTATYIQDTLKFIKSPDFLKRKRFTKFSEAVQRYPYTKGLQIEDYYLNDFNNSHQDSITLKQGSYVFNGWTTLTLKIYYGSKYAIVYRDDVLLTRGSFTRNHNVLEMHDDLGFLFYMFVLDDCVLYKHDKYFPWTLFFYTTEKL